MHFSKSRVNVSIGVLTGLLVGFVFGVAFGNTDKTFTTEGKAKGNVSELARYRYKDIDAALQESAGIETDTLRLTAVDHEGQTWNIIMTK